MKIRMALRRDLKTISEFSVQTYIDAFGHTFTHEELERRLEERSIDYYTSAFNHDNILLAEEGVE